MIELADRLQKVALFFILCVAIIVASIGSSVGSVLTYRYFVVAPHCQQCQPCKCVECECCEGCCK